MWVLLLTTYVSACELFTNVILKTLVNNYVCLVSSLRTSNVSVLVLLGSCDNIRCPAGKHCLLDQNLSPHCVRCSQRCPTPSTATVCGTDAVTYQSACHLREAACRKGKAIPVAYKGRCKSKSIVLFHSIDTKFTSLQG